MHKLIALYINEMIKTFKKTSILVMTILLVVGILAAGGLMRLQDTMMTDSWSHRSDDAWMIEEMQHMKSRQQEELSQLESQRANLSEPDDAAEIELIEEQIASAEDFLAIYELAVDENIMLISGETYLNQAVYGLLDLKRNIRLLETVPPGERDDAWQEEVSLLQSQLERQEGVIQDRDFAAFLELEAEKIEQQPGQTDEQKAFALERLELWPKLDPSGGMDDMQWGQQVQQSLRQVESLRRSLAEGIDYTSYDGPVPMTPERFEELENHLAVLLHRIDEGIIEADRGFLPSDNAMQSMTGFGFFMLVMMMLILAGGCISQEIATGSIKSLIIAPARRWKIFVAKLLSLFSVSLLGLVLIYGMSLLVYGLFFGLSDAAPYIYARNAQAFSLGFPVYQLGRMSIMLLDVWLFMFLALALSALTRNTAASVGIGMAAYFGSSLVRGFLIFLPDMEWVKFLPFANTGLVSRVFAFDGSAGMTAAMYGIAGGREPSVLFSLIYLLALSVCLIHAAGDSFCRRDIK